VQEALRSGELSAERHRSWLKLQRELRAMAMRTDARLRRDEKRKWQQRTRDGRDRMKHKRGAV
jgi:ribosome biogenesis GTPase